ncbi:MAG: amidase [Planctomycetaceae bacterium]|nr:MAG: amidase [Planctomycetaceae bacterium]
MYHLYHPEFYYHTLGPYPPVLTLQSGDTIKTSTVDARGYDARGEAVTSRGNPQTGPFAIAGAEPGDTLLVRLERIWPNRRWAWSRSHIAEPIVEPEYVRHIPEADLVEWELDLERGVAAVKSPQGVATGLILPLEPMLGCFGVAPPRHQAISTATAGEYGGNMDYRGFVAGTTVYFPVFEPGALLFVGDGHAAQGCGEILGTGLEVSMEVEFTVQLLKGRTIRWPRGENSEWIFTVGCGRPLDACVQHATTEMLRWLTTDYGLDVPSAHLVLGHGVRYDLGNMYDPAYCMVCKLPKKSLQHVAKAIRSERF